MSELHEKVLENIPNLVLVLDESRNVVYINRAFYAFCEKRIEDVVGKPLVDVLPINDDQKDQLLGEILAHVEQDEKPPTPKRITTGIRESSGDPLNAKISSSTEFHPPSVLSMKDQMFSYEVFHLQKRGETPSHTGIIFTDLTEEREFLDRMTQAENMFNLKTLVAGISHEVSNPLHTILCFSEAILSETDPEIIRSHAKKVEETSRRLGQVFSRFSECVQGKAHGIREGIDLNENLETALQFALLPYPDHKIQLETRFEELPEIQGDPEEVRQIFINILNNAIQAMNLNGQLTLTTQALDDRVVVWIQDNGPGMPREVLRKIFNPFFTTKKQGEGTGLGLSITQKLVEKNRGKLEIQSREGQGTTVSVIFPAAP